MTTSPDTTQWPEGPIPGVIIRPVDLHHDPRGWLGEVFRSDEIPEDLLPAMGYISSTHPDVIRGPHEHLYQTDMFGFIGPGSFRFRLWDNRKHLPTYGNALTLIVGVDNPVVAIVPPGVVHGYRNISNVDAWSLNFPNKLYQKDKSKGPPDEIRHEMVAGSPFIL
jgi:dTDP-4-dehydrorhamnose 3,5-epimerase